MHRAPAVSVSVTPSRWHLRAIVALGLLALISTLGFVLTQADFDWRAFVLVGLTAVVIGVAVRGWHRSPRGKLAWDGQQWDWSGFAAPQACTLTLRMDFQVAMLVSLVREGGKPVHLWLQAAMGEPHWRALRRAIISSQRLPVPDIDALPSIDHGGQP